MLNKLSLGVALSLATWRPFRKTDRRLFRWSLPVLSRRYRSATHPNGF